MIRRVWVFPPRFQYEHCELMNWPGLSRSSCWTARCSIEAWVKSTTKCRESGMGPVLRIWGPPTRIVIMVWPLFSWTTPRDLERIANFPSPKAMILASSSSILRKKSEIKWGGNHATSLDAWSLSTFGDIFVFVVQAFLDTLDYTNMITLSVF